MPVYAGQKAGWAWVLGVIAVVFNPIIPVHLDRSMWQVLDVVAAGVFLVSAFVVPENNGRQNRSDPQIQGERRDEAR